MADPDTLPDSFDPTGPCPHCGRTSNYSYEGSFHLAIQGIQPEVGINQASLLRCMGCKKGVMVVEELTSLAPSTKWKGIYWWPTPGALDLDPAIPEPIGHAYSEGMRCLSVQCPSAAAVMFRRGLEAIVTDRGSKEAQQALTKSLSRALTQMATDHTLEPSIVEWAKEIRLVGNVGAHFDPLSRVEIQDAEDLGRLVRQILTYLYELPARVSRSRMRRSTPPQTP